jgi:acetolactate synthase-1/2/3 large subunit
LKINKENTRFFTAAGQCSMGYGLPGAIGSYIANPNNTLILIAGDGGFQLNIQELQTIVEYNIPIKIFILNNNGYLAIKLMQKNLFNSKYVASTKKSGVSSPDFITVAQSYGLKTFSINNNNEVIRVLNEVMECKEYCLCNINMLEEQLITPRVQSNGKNNSLEYMFPYIDDNELTKDLDI